MIKSSRHMARVAALGCILCRRLGYLGTPAEVHHIRTGTGADWGAPSDGQHREAYPERHGPIPATDRGVRGADGRAVPRGAGGGE